MPVLECVKIGNKLYCYNSEDNTVSSYLEQRVSLNECPDYVIGAFINKKYNVKIAIKENDKE
jgi:hypothetical protein